MADETTPQPYRIKVNIKTGEFEASGSQDLVREDYDKFIKAVHGLGQPGTREALPLPRLPNQITVGAVDSGVSPDLLDRVFIVQNDLISLRALPNTDNSAADSLLLLLWGYLNINGDQHLSALTLMNAARQSGLPIERLDRTMATIEQYTRRAGKKRGTRYTLNNAGIARSQQLASSLFE